MYRCITLSALVLSAACVTDAQPAPTAQAEATWLYDLSEGEVLDLAEAYDVEATGMLAQMSAPFDCSLFGDLCAEVGEDAAYELIGDVIDLAREGWDVEEIQLALAPQIEEATELWADQRAMVLSVESDSDYVYYSDSGWDYRYLQEVIMSNMTVYIEHKSRGTNYYESAPGTWTKIAADISLTIDSERVKSGVTSTRSDSKRDTSRQVYVVNTMSTGGNQTATGCGRVVGETATECLTVTHSF